MKRWLPVVAGLLGLGVLVWLLLLRGGDAPRATSPDVAARPVEGAPAPRAAGGDRGGDRGDGAPAAVRVDDDPPGTLRLEGQVIDADKQPVAGATVVLSSNPPRTTTSEQDGSFAFDGLVGRPYRLVARAPAGTAGPVTARLTATTEPVILELRPASSVTVEVVDDKGAPVDGATVELRGLDTQTATTTQGAARFAPVVPDGYQIAAWAPGFARAYQWLPVAGEAVTARVALRRGAPVAGKVVTDDGAPVAGARVIYGGASDWSVQLDDRRDGQVTGADGRFRFEAVGAGSARFEATHPDHAPGSSAIVVLDGVTPVDDVVITVPAGAVVSGQVVDDTGAPVASARVRIGVAGASFVSGPPRQVFSDEAGRFTVRGLPRRALEAVALAEGGASATAPVDATAGDVDGVRLVIDVTGTIAGVVVDPSGEPLEGVQVSAGPDFRGGDGFDFSTWRLRGFPEDLTDAGGRFTLTGLLPGTYRLSATRSARRGRGPRGLLGDAVTAKPGDTDVQIVLAPDGGVKGTVAFDDGTAPATFSVSVAFATSPFATADGGFQVDDLPPGEHELEIRGSGFAPKRLRATVEAGKVTDLGVISVVKGRTVRGVVVARGAPVAGATVYVGTQIFGTGTTNKAQFGGPPGGQSTREITTGEDGTFEVSGFPARRDLTLVAEHEAHGRSKAMRIVVGDPGEQALTVALEPFGALSGSVTQGGAIAEGVIVNVQSTTAPAAAYGVATGADGAYRLDRLAPDTYKVSAMTGVNPMRGMGFFSKTVTVASGQEVRVDITMDKGPLALAVTPKANDDGPVGGVAIILSGTFSATTYRELQLQSAGQGEGTSGFNVVIPGRPLRFEGLAPGKHTACVAPLPREVQGMQGMGYFQEHADDLPAFCKGVTLAEQPTEQQLVIEVELPRYVAPEGGETPQP